MVSTPNRAQKVASAAGLTTGSESTTTKSFCGSATTRIGKQSLCCDSRTRCLWGRWGRAAELELRSERQIPLPPRWRREAQLAGPHRAGLDGSPSLAVAQEGGPAKSDWVGNQRSRDQLAQVTELELHDSARFVESEVDGSVSAAGPPYRRMAWSRCIRVSVGPSRPPSCRSRERRVHSNSASDAVSSPPLRRLCSA